METLDSAIVLPGIVIRVHQTGPRLNQVVSNHVSTPAGGITYATLEKSDDSPTRYGIFVMAIQLFNLVNHIGISISSSFTRLGFVPVDDPAHSTC